MHPLKNILHWEMHLDDGNMPKQFHPIPMHVSLRNQPPSPSAIFYFSRDSCIHWPRCFYGQVHNDEGNMLIKFQVNPFFRLGDMDKTILLQKVVQKYYMISIGRPRRSYKTQYDRKMGQKIMYSLGKIDIGRPTPLSSLIYSI